MIECINTGKACLLALLIGLLGALLCLTPVGVNLEEIGLNWFYQLRGPLPSPKDVAIISIDKSSAEILHLPRDPEKWPRSYYAQLIKKISQQKPAIIAFNINFAEQRNSYNDQFLAETMAEEKNVILSNYLERRSVSLKNKTLFGNKKLLIEKVMAPAPLLEDAALLVCPFPLPKTSSSVKQFWVYKSSAGETFPTCIFHSFVFKTAIKELFEISTKANSNLEHLEHRTKPDFILDSTQKIYHQFEADPPSLHRFKSLLEQSDYSQPKTQLLQSWLNFFDSGKSLYFNHYGKAGTIRTIPFYQALVSDILHPDIFHNKIILIGYSENIHPEKNPGFYTVFSNSDAETVSPIEIAATAVANLIDDSWIKPLPLYQKFLLVLLWGGGLAAFCRIFPYKKVIIIIVLASLANFIICYQLFTKLNLWLPIITPMLIQAPLLMVIATFFHYSHKNRSHQDMEKAFSFYLPKDVVNKISSQPGNEAMNAYGELKQGICLATDAGQYTTLSESLDPMTLADLMNKYYAVMFPLVKRSGGMISDVIGDAMMALWPLSNSQGNPQQAACLTAIAIIDGVETFNNNQEYNLPTRIGLHYGVMRLGNVGAKEHYEYRAVGDIINTATRIEGLNKLLGTRALASTEVIQGLSGIMTREVGNFILKGKTKPINIHELMGLNQNNADFWPALVIEFSKALKLFQHHQWPEALETFLKISKQYPEDGPTLFYINYLISNQPFQLAELASNSFQAVIKTERINELSP
jgi:adenylate cyclase